MRYVIRIVLPGGVAWLRHGGIAGKGPIVRFNSRKAAEHQLAFIQQGLDADAIAQVVPMTPANVFQKVEP